MKREIEQYYQENGRKIYLYLLSLCSEPNTAEELTQETFYRAIKNLNRYEGKSSVFTWLCGIAKHLWLQEIDRRTRHPTTELDLYYQDNSPSPVECTEQKDSKLFILKQIHELPEQEKEIILLRATGALTFKEIGEIFNRSENWARVTYYRAKQKLKKI